MAKLEIVEVYRVMSKRECDVSNCKGYFLSTRSHGTFLERCDQCQQYDDDDSAAVAFVQDLEDGKLHAIEIATFLISRERL